MFTAEQNTPIRTRTTAFFDKIDVIDRKIYGWRARMLIWASILVLIIAPLADEFLFKDPEDNTTRIANWLFLAFIIILILGFIGSWRNEYGIWTWYQTKTRLRTHFVLFWESLGRIRKKSKLDNIYKVGWFIFFAGIVWKAFQNLSVFVRKPIERLIGKKIVSMRHFELYTRHHYFFLLMIGAVIIIWLAWKFPTMFKRKMKNDFLHLLGLYKPPYQYYSPLEMAMVIGGSTKELVINSKDFGHVNSTIASSKSKLFNDFLIATKSWETGFANYEYEYQVRFERHLKRNLPNATIDMEFPIRDAISGKWIRADMVINKTILVEMKKDDKAGSIQRAKGQMLQYSNIWKDRGPVILLLCNYEYEHARLSFSSTMQDLIKLNRTALTVLAIPK